MQTAQTILEQLGGNRFVAMTGATLFVGSDDSLMFALPARFAKDGINKVRVTLNDSDLYDVTFFRIIGTKVAKIAEDFGVYADMLAQTFTARTGLDTRL